MNLQDNPYFCEHIWTHLYKETDDSVKLCCIDSGPSIGSLREKSLDEIRSSDEFKEIRKDVLSGKKLERCQRCWEPESQGLNSYRKKFDESIHKHFDENPKSIEFIDYRIDNICNLACKSCGGMFSSKLIDVDYELGVYGEERSKFLRYTNKQNQKLLTLKENLNSIKDVYFAGGEPLINQQHWDFLEHLKQNNLLEEVAITYNTNLTKLDFKDYSVENYWPYMRNITVGASIDGMEEYFNYFRTGGNWEDVLKNMRRIVKINPNILELSTTCGWMNISSILELFKFTLEEKLITNINKLGFGFIVGNPGASLENTPMQIKDEIKENINDFISYIKNIEPYFEKYELYNYLQVSINKIDEGSEDKNETEGWLNKLKLIDKKFGTEFKTIMQFKNKEFNSYMIDKYNYIIL